MKIKEIRTVPISFRSATYTTFGEATVDASSTITNNLRFAGQYFDEETGKHYNWNRYYDPKTGRYTQVDPIGFEAGDANLYMYVRNSVINATDPKGLLMEYYKKPFRLYETAPKGFKDLTKEEKEEAYKSYLETKKKLDEYAFQRDYARFFENKQYKIPGQIIIDVRVEVKEIPHWVCEVGVHVGCHLLCESTGASPVICIPTCIAAAALACPEKCDGKKK